MKILKTLAGLLVMVGLVACGKKTEDKASLKDLNTEIVVQAESGWVDYYKSAIDRVKGKYPKANIKIKEIASFDHLELIDKTDVLNSDVADVFAFPLDRLEPLNQKDVLAAIDAKEIAKKVNGEETLKAGIGKQINVNNEYLAFPMNIETLIAVINTNNAKARKTNINAPIELTKTKDLEFLMPVFNAWWGVTLTNAFDLELLEKDGNEFKSDLVKSFDELSPEQQKMFEGLYNYWKMSEKNRTSLFDTQAVYGYIDKEFVNGGKGVIRVAGPWEIPSMSEQIGDKLEIRDLSTLTFYGKPLKHWQGGWALGVNARNEEDKAKLKLSEELIAELMNPKYAPEFYTAAGKIMPNASFEIYENSQLKSIDKVVIKSVINSYNNAVARPIFKEWGLVWDTWQNAIISWNSQKPKNVKEAYKLVQESFKSLMTNIK